MTPLLIIGTLASLAALTGYLARVLHQRDQARIAAGLARMELRAARVRLAELERTLGLIDSNAAESPEWIRERIRAAQGLWNVSPWAVGHPELGRLIPGGPR